MRLKFPKVGVILMFYLFVAGEDREIHEFVQRRLINKEEYPLIEHTFLRTDSSLNGIALSSNSKKKLTPTTSHISGILRKGSDPINEHTFSSNKEKSDSNHNRREDKDCSGKPLSESLDNIILNFDANGNIAKEDIRDETREDMKDVQLKLDSDEMDAKEKEDSDMQFKQEVQAVSNNELLKVEEMGNEENKGDSRDYGMLKLDSDQGRIVQEPIDTRLEMLELEAIEEEKPSRENTIKNCSQLEGTFSLAKTKGRARQTASIR